MPGVSGTRGVALAAVLKAHVIVNGRPTLLLGLDHHDRNQLIGHEQLHPDFLVYGGDVGLPGMLVGLTYSVTREHLMESLPPTGTTKMHHDPANPLPGPVRIHAKIGPERAEALVLCLSGDNLLELTGGASWVIDGDTMGMPGYHVCLTAYQSDEKVASILARTGASLTREDFSYEAHEHQPAVLAGRGLTLVELYGAGKLTAYAECTGDGRPVRVWAAVAGPGHDCCTKGMA
jgi:hypothetical protein